MILSSASTAHVASLEKVLKTRRQSSLEELQFVSSEMEVASVPSTLRFHLDDFHVALEVVLTRIRLGPRRYFGDVLR